MDIVLAPDNNYAKHASVVMASVLMHNRSNVVFWILDGELTEENKSKLSQIDGFDNCTVNFVKIPVEEFSDFPESGYITRAMWYRLKVASLLPDTVDVCLYLDCDTIVNADLTSLFALNLDGYYAGVGIDCVYEKFVKNHSRYFPKNYQYFNSGVMLINLKGWREDRVEEKIMEFLRANPKALKLLDQTILNINLQEKLIDFGITYNFQFTPKILGETSYYARRDEYREAAKSPKIIHFVGEFKPWKIGFNAVNPYYKLYLKSLSHTPWKISKTEEDDFVKQSEAQKCVVFRKLLFKQIKRKPWWVFRKYFWKRMAL